MRQLFAYITDDISYRFIANKIQSVVWSLQLVDKSQIRPNSYVVPQPCYCRAQPILVYCIYAKNNGMYLVRHGSGSATARRMNWA